MSGEPGGPPRRADPRPPDKVLLALRKAERVALLVLREYAHGMEVRVVVDGSLVFSTLHRATEPTPDIHAAVAEHRADFVAKGWAAVE